MSIKGYKGFHKNLTCGGGEVPIFQYEIGGTYEEPDAIVCKKGFHFCENPLDVFSYYRPGESRYAEVEGDGKTQNHDEDSKIACTKLNVKAEIGFPGLIKMAVQYITEKSDKKNITTNDKEYAATTGNWANAATTGNWANAATTGDRANAATTGDRANASALGKAAIAAGLGIENKAKASLGNWIVIAEWNWNGNEYEIKTVKSAQVDGEIIKDNTWYKLVDGEFVEAGDNE